MVSWRVATALLVVSLIAWGCTGEEEPAQSGAAGQTYEVARCASASSET